ncbi:hypothetical protein ACS0TY_015077 [Phlomoides rotata]
MFIRSEIEKLREEAHASENHMIQYKRIAQVNEDALKQMELSHETLKNEADEVKRSLEHELHSLRERVSELESECKLKAEEAISTTVEKEEALASALSEIASVKDYYSDKMSQIEKMESEISPLKEAPLTVNATTYELLQVWSLQETCSKGIASEFEVRGFPTLKIPRYGGSVVQEYKGPRDADGIVTYLKNASIEIKSPEDASVIINEEKILVVVTLIAPLIFAATVLHKCCQSGAFLQI